MKKLLLCGYMGSGKTTVARILAQKTGIECLDLDHLIEEKAGMAIKVIFEKKGELFFRKLEHEVFSSLMASNKSFILALGGGTPAYANNHLLLKGRGVVSFYLKASIATLHERLLREHDERPLVAQKPGEEMLEIIAKHLFERNFYYSQATHIINTDGKSVQDIASEILRESA